MNNLNEHINRMKQLIGAKHGIIKPLVSEQSPFDDEFDDLINKSNQPTPPKENDLQKGMPSQYKSSEKLYGDDETDDLVNKPGSGKNTIARVPITILNKTTGKEETINAEFYEDENWAEIVMKSDEEFKNFGTRVNLEFESGTYGYYLSGRASKNNYNDGDSIKIKFEVPLNVTSFKADDRPGNVSYVNKNNSSNSTSFEIEAKIIDNTGYFLNIMGIGNTNLESPLKDGEFEKFALTVRFR
jgi:hypothetical protein